jgi:hypothetical protein
MMATTAGSGTRALSWPARAGSTMLAMLLAAGPLAAQDSRAALVAEQQAAKAKSLAPPAPSRAEQVFRRFTSGLVHTTSGFYPTVDSIYGGGGFSLGGGYRRTFGDASIWDVHGLYSVKGYKLLELTTLSRDLSGNLELRGSLGWRDATQVGFYGVGADTSPDQRANFRMKQGYGGLAALVTAARPLVFGAGATYEAYTLDEGRGRAPSIEERYTAETAPGLGDSPSFLHSTASAAIDWRPSAGYARRGGLYQVQYHRYADFDDTHSFDRLDLEVIQHVPVMRETWVLSTRGRVQTTLGDDAVPFFLLPSLGSGSTLRGYHSWRFRDRHSLLLQGEWRWFPNRYGLDLALFVDAGKVTSDRGALDLDGLKTDVGIGARFHGPAQTPVRIELARGSEGWNLVFSGRAAF